MKPILNVSTNRKGIHVGFVFSRAISAQVHVVYMRSIALVVEVSWYGAVYHSTAARSSSSSMGTLQDNVTERRSWSLWWFHTSTSTGTSQSFNRIMPDAVQHLSQLTTFSNKTLTYCRGMHVHLTCYPKSIYGMHLWDALDRHVRQHQPQTLGDLLNFLVK